MSTSRVSASVAPPPNWFEHEEHGHVVQFYAEDLSLLDNLARFIGNALNAGDAGVVIATQAHREGLAQRLKTAHIDVNGAIQQGRYIALDAAETLGMFMEKGWPSAAEFAKVVGPLIEQARVSAGPGHFRVAAFGEMVALLWSEGNVKAALELEKMWNKLAEVHSFSLRCAYPMKSFGNGEHRELFLKICAEHSGVIPGEDYTSLPSEDDRLRSIAHLQQKAEAHETLRIINEELRSEIARRIAAERKLNDSEQSLRKLSGHLLRMQDEERRRVGRELHDSVGQYLAALKMRLESMDSGDSTEFFECVQMADQCMREVRTISYLLYPPMLEEMGLASAIPWYLEGFGKRSGIGVTFDIERGVGRLSRDAELAIFRVLQESLTNVHRHSASPTAEVRVILDGRLVCLEVKDCGKGMPADIVEASRDGVGTLGVGLRGMAERMRQLGGNLELSSSTCGTVVRATIPREA